MPRADTQETPAQTYREIAAAGHPLVFSDGVLSYSIGHQVSRLVFGVETQPGTAAAPVVTLVMPTEALLSMVSDLKAVLNRPDVLQHMKDAIQRIEQRAAELS